MVDSLYICLYEQVIDGCDQFCLDTNVTEIYSSNRVTGKIVRIHTRTDYVLRTLSSCETASRILFCVAFEDRDAALHTLRIEFRRRVGFIKQDL
jgi:hypothetical protein